MHLQGVLGRVDGDSEVAGEQIAGAARNQSAGDGGAPQDGRNGANSSVPAHDAHQIRMRFESRTSGGDSGVLPVRLEPERLTPAPPPSMLADLRLRRWQVPELARVDDDRDAPVLPRGCAHPRSLGRVVALRCRAYSK